MNLHRLFLCIALVFSAGPHLSANCLAGDDALGFIPGSCNAVAVVRVRKLVDSPLGRREKWIDQARQAYAAGLLSAPPWVDEVVRAAVLGSSSRDVGTTYSVYSMRRESAIADIARHELASVEKIEGTFAVLSPRGVYFVQLAPRLVGAVQPADRRAVVRWIRSSRERRLERLSPDLLSAVVAPDGPQIVLAIDLADTLEPKQIRAWLAALRDLPPRSNLDALAGLLASLRGGQLSVQVTDAIAARLKLDFNRPIARDVDALKAIVRDWLEDAGAHLDALSEARTSVRGNSLILEAALSERALRRLMSLIQSPQLAPPGEAPSAETGKPNAVASARYFDSIVHCLKALDRKSRGSAGYENTALWHETFAKKIDELPIAGVDPELLRFGRDVSGKLRALAASLRGVPVEVDKLNRAIRFDAQTYYAWYANSPAGPLYFPAWTRTQNNVADVRARQADVVAANADHREAVWQMLRDETTRIAGKMESKYQVKLDWGR